MTQRDTVLHHMRKQGPISLIEAFRKYGITRLAARIAELRLGHDVKDVWHEGKNGKRFKRYFLA